jgi:hypothetical protein
MVIGNAKVVELEMKHYPVRQIPKQVSVPLVYVGCGRGQRLGAKDGDLDAAACLTPLLAFALVD